MQERIYAGFHQTESDVFLIDVDENTSIALGRPQVEQLIIDLQSLLAGIEPTEEAAVEGVE